MFHKGLRVKTNDDFLLVDLTVRPVIKDASDPYETLLFLVILEESTLCDHKHAEAVDLPADEKKTTLTCTDSDVRIEALKRELRAKDEYLQSTHEELETSNEELKSSNEEMQSLNEEMQSTNEELETSKEELQSINEELATVNAELQTKVSELSQGNDDMNNLLSGTGIAMVFVDHQLRILRFTPTATEIINLIMTDVGRPLSHINSNLVGYYSLVTDAQAVLDTLTSKVMEVQTSQGKWYTMRIRPYLTLNHVFEGAVVTFSDITELVETRESLKASAELSRLAIIVRDSSDAIMTLDLDGQVIAWNPSAQRVFGWSEAEALSMNIRDLIPEDLREKELGIVRQIITGTPQVPYSTQRVAKDGQVVEVLLTATNLLDEGGC